MGRRIWKTLRISYPLFFRKKNISYNETKKGDVDMKYNEFHDGFSRGTLLMANEIRELIEYLGTVTLTKEDMIDELKRTLNDTLVIHIAANDVGITQEAYDVWVGKNKLIRTDVKYKLIGNLMDYKE
jgi:hypothetical protein